MSNRVRGFFYPACTEPNDKYSKTTRYHQALLYNLLVLPSVKAYILPTYANTHGNVLQTAVVNSNTIMLYVYDQQTCNIQHVCICNNLQDSLSCAGLLAISLQ